jgi:hypothetical protein
MLQKLPKIVAIDFDGTLVENNFPEIGLANVEIVEYVKYLKHTGHKVILWTCRCDTSERPYLSEAVKFCIDELDLEFDEVNKNLKEVRDIFKQDTRKVYADIYIDDKGVDLLDGTRIQHHKKNFRVFKPD